LVNNDFFFVLLKLVIFTNLLPLDFWFVLSGVRGILFYFCCRLLSELEMTFAFSSRWKRNTIWPWWEYHDQSHIQKMKYLLYCGVFFKTRTKSCWVWKSNIKSFGVAWFFSYIELFEVYLNFGLILI